jgi:hypothetical protein
VWESVLVWFLSTVTIVDRWNDHVKGRVGVWTRRLAAGQWLVGNQKWLYNAAVFNKQVNLRWCNIWGWRYEEAIIKLSENRFNDKKYWPDHEASGLASKIYEEHRFYLEGYLKVIIQGGRDRGKRGKKVIMSLKSLGVTTLKSWLKQIHNLRIFGHIDVLLWVNIL